MVRPLRPVPLIHLVSPNFAMPQFLLGNLLKCRHPGSRPWTFCFVGPGICTSNQLPRGFGSMVGVGTRVPSQPCHLASGTEAGLALASAECGAGPAPSSLIFRDHLPLTLLWPAAPLHFWPLQADFPPHLEVSSSVSLGLCSARRPSSSPGPGCCLVPRLLLFIAEMTFSFISVRLCDVCVPS